MSDLIQALEWEAEADDYSEMPFSAIRTLAAAARRVAEAPEVWWCEVHQRTAPPLIDGSKNCRSADDTPCRMVRRLLVDPGDEA